MPDPEGRKEGRKIVSMKFIAVYLNTLRGLGMSCVKGDRCGGLKAFLCAKHVQMSTALRLKWVLFIFFFFSLFTDKKINGQQINWSWTLWWRGYEERRLRSDFNLEL